MSGSGTDRIKIRIRIRRYQKIVDARRPSSRQSKFYQGTGKHPQTLLIGLQPTLIIIAPKLTIFNSVRNLDMDKHSSIEFGGE